MTHLRLYETPNLGVHQTGSSSQSPSMTFELSELGIFLLALFRTPQAVRLGAIQSSVRSATTSLPG
jgi:hypothetical protein